MDIEALIVSYGGPGLLLISFIAATIIPLSSEAAVIAAVWLVLPPTETLVWASVGNCLGITLNYWLGRLGRKKIDDRGKEPTGRVARTVRWLERYGKWSLLLSWLPFVGDPMTLVAGVSRVNFLFFVVVAFSVRVLRYWLVLIAIA
ncbi:MAG: DedA family protein [bacterium]|nr:DedA family protein [Candidatus Kapabacteria bacterium]